MAAPLAVSLRGEQLNLSRRDSQASLASEGDQKNDRKNKDKPDKPKTKEVNWVTKGKAKVKDAKAVATDARCLRRTIEQAQENPETQKHLG